MAYSKLFSSIVHSSLWTEEDHVRLLFVTLLAIADREGYVYGSRMGLERLANVIADDHERNPWDALLDPDPDSSDLMRNPENEGRRIEEVPGGFRILNYCYYRSLRNDEDRREQNRDAQRRYREKLTSKSAKSSQRKPASAKVSRGNPPSSHAEAEAEADTEAEKIYRAFPLKVGKPEAIKAIVRALCKTTFDDLLAKTKAFSAARNGDTDFCPNPATWFNQERFNDDPKTWKPKNPANKSKPKEKAPSYPKMSEHREPTDEEVKKWRESGESEVAKLREKFKMP